jgi:hypothetical protein
MPYKLSGLYDAIADGLRGSGLQEKLDALEAEKLDITLCIKTPKSATVSLLPALAELYQQKLRNLAEVLQNPKMRDQAQGLQQRPATFRRWMKDTLQPIHTDHQGVRLCGAQHQ